MLFAKTTAAVHWVCIIADLDEQLILIGVTAVSQGCYQPDLHSNIEQQRMLFAKTTAAVHWDCIIADLDEQEILIGVTAVSQSCCQPVLQSSLEQWGVRFCQEQCCSALGLHHCRPV